MAFQIVKGWPADGAIDPVVSVYTSGSNSTGVVVGGTVIMLTSNGYVKAAYDDHADVEAPAFVIDVDTTSKTAAGLATKVTALMSPCIIEVDSDHFVGVIGGYAINNMVTCKAGSSSVDAGKFQVCNGTDGMILGRILSVDATNSKLRILWAPMMSV